MGSLQGIGSGVLTLSPAKPGRITALCEKTKALGTAADGGGSRDPAPTLSCSGTRGFTRMCSRTQPRAARGCLQRPSVAAAERPVLCPSS